MAPKRKRTMGTAATDYAQKDAAKIEGPQTNPQLNGDIIDAPNALRASPDSDVDKRLAPGSVKSESRSESPLSDVPEEDPPKKKKRAAAKAPGKKTAAVSTPAAAVAANGNVVKSEDKTNGTPAAKKKKETKKQNEDVRADPEAEGEEEEADEEELQEAMTRPPPVNSDYLPLPWKGRLGYACLNTYLRYSTPPVFSSRTCRIASILEHRHPLRDPSQPEHATKNRPDREKPADVKLGQQYVEAICLANVRDVSKMLRWNDKYGIKFLRLSSEMFPFASHPEYGYKLAPFAAEALAEVGKVIAELGHRVTTHPGQFTQLGSPRKSVIDNALRDLEYHDEMLSLLKLPDQANRDAVMILHLGGVFEGKAETLDRFRANYAKLPQSVKNRLVLENDDVSWTVHDLLPVCEELNIPMVLDYHHHNIMFDSTQIREGTKDIIDLYPRIKATWDRKQIRQKMHYSEPTPAAITGRQRRKHNPRVATLPPCAQDMDLMIEAKDKEQAVFELMRTFKLPGFETFNDIIPHVRADDNKLALQQANRKKKAPSAAASKKKSKKAVEENNDDDDDTAESAIESQVDAAAATGPIWVPEAEVGMGGPESRVYWPPTMEDWLRPKKREIKKKEPEAINADGTPKSSKKLTPAQKKKKKIATDEAEDAEAEAEEERTDDAVGAVKTEEADALAEADTPATAKAKKALQAKFRRDAAVKIEKEREKESAAAAAAAAAAAPLASAPAPVNNTRPQPPPQPQAKSKSKAKAKAKPKPKTKAREEKIEVTPPTSEEDLDAGDEAFDSEGSVERAPVPLVAVRAGKGNANANANGGVSARKSGRGATRKRISYKEVDMGDEDVDEDEEGDLVMQG